MPDDATVEIALKWVQEGEAAFREVQARLGEIAAQIQITNLILRSTAQVTTDMAAATNEVSKATQGSNQSLIQQAWATLTAAQGWAQVAVWVGVAAVAFLPVAAVIASATVALISFTAGAAGFLAIAGLVGGAFAAIGAGVLLLGGGGGIGAAAALTSTTDKLASATESLQEFDAAHTGVLTTLQAQQREQLVENIAKAQNNYNDALARSQGPTGVLIAQLGAMKQAWADLATPIAAVITQWAAGAIPAVQALGGAIITWFGDRIPGVLAGISKVVRDLTPDFIAFGQYFGAVMDKVGPQLAPMAEAMARLGLQGVQGLIGNLVRLSDWFQKELPSLGPIVAQVFGFLGTSIQGVASGWASLTDWVVKNWPATVKLAQQFLGDLKTDFHNLNGQELAQAVQGFIDLGRFIEALVGIIAKVVGPLSALYQALKPIVDLAAPFTDFMNAISGVAGGATFVNQTIHTTGGSSSTPNPITNPARQAAPPSKSIAQHNTFNISGATDPNATARAVRNALRNAMAN